MARTTVMTRLRARLREQDGSSPVTAVGGLLIFLGFLFLAVQVTVHLYTISTAGTIALEAANRAAQGGGAPGCAQARTWADGRLGAWADPVTCGTTLAGDQVIVTVAGTSPVASMRVFKAATGLSTIHRSARVRVEEDIDAGT
jgi:hypothetical protein